MIYQDAMTAISYFAGIVEI